MSTWEFLLTDRTGVSYGELRDASSRTVSVPLNRVPTGSFTIKNNNPLIGYARQMDQTLVQAWRTPPGGSRALIAQGPIVPTYSKTVNANSDTTQFTWAGVGWRLSRRIIPASRVNAGATYASAAAPVDRGVIAWAIITDCNTDASLTANLGDTGIRIGSVTPGSTTYAGPWFYKNALQAINDLSASSDLWDWRIDPVVPYQDALGWVLGSFSSAPVLGTTEAEAVFEYGDGRFNVSGFTENADFSGAMNRGWILPPGYPNGTTQQVIGYGSTSAFARGVVYEDVLTSDLVSADMRAKLLYDNISVRSAPRQVIAFQPTVDPTLGVAPQYGSDYREGDVVSFRAVEYGQETINALFRIYEVDFSIDDQGNETATPILVDQGTS